MSAKRVTRADLEQGFRGLQDDLQGRVEDRKGGLVTAAVGVGVVLVVAFFLLGRRSGKKRSTLVEIRRL
ncbi:MAG: hypothetical protein ACKOD2_19330 [Ilumatobacteraceae bacterium]|jgi:hypothetical protein